MNVYDDRRLAAVAVLESLRAGVPTRTSTQTLPDLRADLTSIIRSDLEMFFQGKIIPGRLIWGSYGQGKPICSQLWSIWPWIWVLRSAVFL